MTKAEHQARYKNTPKGRATDERYDRSPKGRLRRMRYNQSPLGFENKRRKRANARQKNN